MHYSTSFPIDEDHIDEGGKWINGDTAGVVWGYFYTKNSIAYGVDGPGKGCPDAVSLVTGDWAPDQSVELTIYKGKPTHYAEYEMRLRCEIRPDWSTGYEVMWAPTTETHVAYMIVVYWPGPLGEVEDYPALFTGNGPEWDLDDGDIVKADIVGNVITVYKNGDQVAQCSDPNNLFTSGNPGMGVNFGSELNGDYGFRKFTAADVSG